MARTNVVLDETIVEKAKALSGITTTKGVIDAALQEFVMFRSRKNLLELRERVQLNDTYDYKAARETR
jgi:hypothetical protein